MQVIQRLHEAGYQAYLVGGSVRDLLLGLHPKDFDVATNAHPEKIRKLFKNSRIIGKRFQLVHVVFGREMIEVSTFRKQHPTHSHPEGRLSESGMLLRDNIFGDIEDDAWRRDFSINALYYDPETSQVIDYTNGLPDIDARLIRVLGDPVIRYQEDPVRMLRAIRLAAKLNFSIESSAKKQLLAQREALTHVPNARLFDVTLKLFYCGHSTIAFQMLCDYGFFKILFPQTEQLLHHTEKKESPLKLIIKACENTDHRIKNKQTLNPAFLFATMLWAPLQQQKTQLKTQGHRSIHALNLAMQKVIQKQTKIIGIPKRYVAIIEDIWTMQHSLEAHQKNRVSSLFNHPRFRAAYDFLLLRYESGESSLKNAVEYWQHLQKTGLSEA